MIWNRCTDAGAYDCVTNVRMCLDTYVHVHCPMVHLVSVVGDRLNFGVGQLLEFSTTYMYVFGDNCNIYIIACLVQDINIEECGIRGYTHLQNKCHLHVQCIGLSTSCDWSRILKRFAEVKIRRVNLWAAASLPTSLMYWKYQSKTLVGLKSMCLIRWQSDNVISHCILAILRAENLNLRNN